MQEYRNTKKHKIIFAKRCIPNWPKKAFVVENIKILCRGET